MRDVMMKKKWVWKIWTMKWILQCLKMMKNCCKKRSIKHTFTKSKISQQQLQNMLSMLIFLILMIILLLVLYTFSMFRIAKERMIERWSSIVSSSPSTLESLQQNSASILIMLKLNCLHYLCRQNLISKRNS